MVRSTGITEFVSRDSLRCYINLNRVFNILSLRSNINRNYDRR